MYEYEATVRWKNDRICTLITGSGNTMKLSSPPEFKGVKGYITPEELFVATENACILMTFIAYAEKMRVEFLSYECEAVGYLEREEKGFLFTRISLRPRVVIKRVEDYKKIERALELAESRCLITNSITSKVEMEPEIVVSS